MPATRTHTVFFSDESLQALETAYKGLVSDFRGRSSYMSEEAMVACYQRLELVRLAIERLKDKAE
jgi:hypothetical protein